MNTEQIEALRAEPLAGPNKLKRAIEIAQTTQERLEEATGLRQAYISAIVNGKYSKLPLETARKFADHFGCQIEDLFPSREAIAS